ncbi:MAG: hypothetical protein R3F61_03030 [Myxococcota bacterium]
MLAGFLVGCTPALAPWVDADVRGMAAYSSRPERGVVGSREYKLLLDPVPFEQDEPWARSVIWGDLATLAQSADFEVEGDFTVASPEREVRFYDTPGSCELNARGFVFRERVVDGERSVTIKFRSPDRYVSAAKPMETDGEGRTKLEEDISAPFVSRFSHSTTMPISASKNLNALNDPLRLVPGIAPYFADLDDSAPLAVVGGTTFAETVFRDASIDLGPLEAEPALTLWRVDGHVEVAELSFAIEADHEGFDERSSARALWLFEALQSHAWVSPDARTKTRTAYERDAGFCPSP